MKRKMVLAVCVALALVVSVTAAEALKSGPQVGEELPGPFEPLNVTGEDAGKNVCQYCKNGINPVAMVFARELSPPLVSLIKKIDEATGKNATAQMGSFVVFLSHDEKLPDQLKEMAKKENLKQVVLCMDHPVGPERYNVVREAEVTVVLYTDLTVKANHVFKKSELKDADVEKIIADVAKIVAK